MRPRAVFLDGVMFLLGGFLKLFYIRFSFNILLSGLGVVFGLVFGVGVALIRLNSLEKNGEFRATLKTLAFALLTIIILVPIALYLVFTFGLEFGFQMVSFLYPFFLASFAAKIALYLRWERKHKKHILFDGLVFTRVYTVPRDLESRVD